MRAHTLQHVPFEGLGSIAGWLDRNGHTTTFTRFFDAQPQLPAPDGFDLLVIMGGPMSVNDEARLPWLIEEKRLVRAALGAGKPVLGICLGAQLIASALGSRVYPNPEREIGWFPVDAAAHSDGDVFAFPSSAGVFHWHGETFDLPSGARLLASSEGCRNQAFQIGSRVIGLQFHLETTPESAQTIVSYCRDELVPARYVQDEATILAAPLMHYQAINDLMGRVLAYLTRP